MAAVSGHPRMLRLRSRALLHLAMAPGNGGLPRPRLWRAALPVRGFDHESPPVLGLRRRLRRALRALRARPPVIRNAATPTRELSPRSRRRHPAGPGVSSPSRSTQRLFHNPMGRWVQRSLAEPVYTGPARGQTLARVEVTPRHKRPLLPLPSAEVPLGRGPPRELARCPRPSPVGARTGLALVRHGASPPLMGARDRPGTGPAGDTRPPRRSCHRDAA